VNAQLDDTFSDRFAVTKISCLKMTQTNADARLGEFVAYCVEPDGKRLPAILSSKSM